jgi:histone H3/H4
MASKRGNRQKLLNNLESTTGKQKAVSSNEKSAPEKPKAARSENQKKKTEEKSAPQKQKAVSSKKVEKKKEKAEESKPPPKRRVSPNTKTKSKIPATYFKSLFKDDDNKGRIATDEEDNPATVRASKTVVEPYDELAEQIAERIAQQLLDDEELTVDSKLVRRMLPKQTARRLITKYLEDTTISAEKHEMGRAKLSERLSIVAQLAEKAARFACRSTVLGKDIQLIAMAMEKLCF